MIIEEKCTFECHKRMEISCASEQQLTFEERLWYTKFGTEKGTFIS
jgi:hypothetical protein